jgi:flagellar basal body-associated protein FliL
MDRLPGLVAGGSRTLRRPDNQMQNGPKEPAYSRPTPKNIVLGLFLAVVICAALGAVAYFGSTANPNTKTESTSLKNQQPPPPGTSGK